MCKLGLGLLAGRLYVVAVCASGTLVDNIMQDALLAIVKSKKDDGILNVTIEGIARNPFMATKNPGLTAERALRHAKETHKSAQDDHKKFKGRLEGGKSEAREVQRQIEERSAKLFRKKRRLCKTKATRSIAHKGGRQHRPRASFPAQTMYDDTMLHMFLNPNNTFLQVFN